jgi:hypothetical protein
VRYLLEACRLQAALPRPLRREHHQHQVLDAFLHLPRPEEIPNREWINRGFQAARVGLMERA